MNTIKFSHRYQKLGVIGNRLGSPYTALLVSVQEINLKDLPKDFLKYDTDDGKYELPKSGKYLLLLFLAVGGLFTTLRAAFPERKIDYYKSKIGLLFLKEKCPCV